MRPAYVPLVLLGSMLGCAKPTPSGLVPQLAFDRVPLAGGAFITIGGPPLTVTDSTTRQVLLTYWEHHFVPIAHTIQWSRNSTESLDAVLEVVLDTLGVVESVTWHYGLGVTQTQVRAILEHRYGRGRELRAAGEPYAIRWMRGQLGRVLTVDPRTQLVTQWLGLIELPRPDLDADLHRLMSRCLEEPDFAAAFCSTPWRWLHD